MSLGRHHGKPVHRSRLRQAGQRGFTIVEVIIVLAIGGLILLIVFEAIPALTRNSRNNSRKQDVANILQAVSHYELNHSADFPPNVAGIQPYLPQLYFYTAGNISLTAQAASSGTRGPATDDTTVKIYNYELCSATATGQATSVGAGYSDIVAIYGIESGAGFASQCQQL